LSMIMRRNLLRERLNAGQPTVGTHILSCWPTLVELIGHSGQYDYVEFTAEYAPFDMHDLDNLGRAFEVANLGGMIKLEQTQYTDPEVLAAETPTIELALKQGLHPRVELRDPGGAAKYLEMGVKHFCIGWDVRILADWWDAKGAEMRGLVEGKAKPATAKPA